MSYKESANTLRNTPDENGHFGIFGGQYVAETLMPLIIEVCDAWRTSKNDPSFGVTLLRQDDERARAPEQNSMQKVPW